MTERVKVVVVVDEEGYATVSTNMEGVSVAVLHEAWVSSPEADDEAVTWEDALVEPDHSLNQRVRNFNKELAEAVEDTYGSYGDTSDEDDGFWEFSDEDE